MTLTTTTPWLNHLILAKVADRSGAITEFYRAARAGRFLRLAKGVYIPSSVWRALDADEQFLARIHATDLVARSGIVYSHLSAAALWRLPNVNAWPERSEAIVGSDQSGVTRRGFLAHQYPMPARTVVIDGLPVTTLERTLIDVGRTSPLSVAVAMIDRGLAAKSTTSGVYGAVTTIGALSRELLQAQSGRGVRRCREALEISDAMSGSPGESVSRTGIHLLGLPAPVLQHEFRDAFGRMIVDFWWPQFNLIGEFDGMGKYLREELRSGQTVAEAVIAEKRREDRLRALGPKVTRWGWNVATSLPALNAHLREAGLR